MDDIIQRIIDSEKRAQQIVSSARDERQAHEDMMHGELEDYRKKTADANRARILDFAEQQRREADTGIKHSEDSAKLKIVQLQQTASRRRDDWIEHLYRKILDGDIG